MRLMASAALAVVVLVPAVPAVAAAAPAVKIVKVQYDAPGPDTLSNAQLNREYLVIQNVSRRVVSLKGWRLFDESRHGFKFGAYKLKPKQKLIIRTGRGKATRTTVYMNRKWYVWNNDTDTATLFNAAGKKVTSRLWGKQPAGNDPRFDTCAEANDAGYGPYYKDKDPEYDWYQDRDGDGVACER